MIVETHTLAGMFRAIAGRLRSSGHEVVYFTDPARAAESREMPAADILIAASNLKCDRALMMASPKLRAVLYGAIGTDGIDLAAASELGIVVGHGPTAQNYRSMAEATVLLMLALLYDLRGSEEILRRNQPRPLELRGRMLAGRTIGLIGFGRIARTVAENLSSWGAKLQTYTRSPERAAIPREVRSVGLDELLATSDIVSIHATRNPQSEKLIGERELALMKPTALLVNTARGGIVDERALVQALQERRIAGAALDTFEAEPLSPHSALRRLDNVILTPHLLGHTRDLMESLEATLLESVGNVLAGAPPRYVRNPEVLARWGARWGKAAA